MRGTAMSTTSDPTSTGTRTTKTKASDIRERKAIEHLPCCADCAAMELRVVASGEGLAEHEPGPRAWPNTSQAQEPGRKTPCPRPIRPNFIAMLARSHGSAKPLA